MRVSGISDQMSILFVYLRFYKMTLHLGHLFDNAGHTIKRLQEPCCENKQ